jgi:hypothetical protein
MCVRFFLFSNLFYFLTNFCVVNASGPQPEDFYFLPEKPGKNFYRNIPLDLTDDEKEALDSFQISFDSTAHDYHNFGDLDNLGTGVKSFIQDLGNGENVSNQISKIICNMTLEILEKTDFEAAWVRVFSNFPNSNFDTPRWHRDGFYYESEQGFNYQLLAVLKGNGTLFCELPEERAEKFDLIECRDDYFINEDLRQRTDKIVKSSCEIIKAEPLSITLFCGGGGIESIVHSEPKMDSIRLLVKIVPGTREQIDSVFLGREVS